jgi:hypothetical protein
VALHLDPTLYPRYESLLEILQRWNPDDTSNIPNPFLERLQCFNYSDPHERALAEVFRNAEVPFKLFGIPEIEHVAAKWTDAYLSKKMKGNIDYKVEKSQDNHFM